MVGVASIIILALAGLTPPLTAGRGRSPDQTEAVNHARQIGMALWEFQTHYGSRPDGSTIEAVRQETSTNLKLGTKSSNDFFRQLLAVGIVNDESMFYAKITGARKPDSFLPGTKALEKGECAFTYFAGAPKDCSPQRPVAITPAIAGTDRFDPKPFKGKAILLRMDNSVTTLPIRESNGQVWFDGQNLMDPSHPIWEGHAPAIAWPEL